MSGGLVAPTVLDGEPIPATPVASTSKPSGFRKLASSAPVASMSTPPRPPVQSAAPTFQRAGYTTLDTGSTPLPSTTTDATPLRPLLVDGPIRPAIPLAVARPKSMVRTSALGEEEDELVPANGKMPIAPLKMPIRMDWKARR